MDGHLGRLEFVIVRRPHVVLKRCEVMFRQTLKSCAFASRVERLGLVICPSGCFLTGVSSLFSGFPKNISFGSHSPQINSRTLDVPAHRGAFRDRHGRWAWDAVDAAASGAQRGCRAGWRKARERSPSERTRCCSGRQNRVVLTPRRWRQVRGV